MPRAAAYPRLGTGRQRRHERSKQVDRLQSEGIKVIDADKDPGIAAMEECLEPALPSSLRINTWEMRWPLNTSRTRDAAKISPLLLDRLRDAESMTVGDYRCCWQSAI